MLPPEVRDKSNEEVAVGIDAPLHSTKSEGFLLRMLDAVRESAPEYSPTAYRLTAADDQSEAPATPLNEVTTRQLARALQTAGLRYAFLTRGDPAVVTIMLSSLHKSAVPYDLATLSAQRGFVSSSEGRKRFVTAAHSIAMACDAYLADFGTWGLRKTTSLGRVVLGATHRGLPPLKWGYLLGRDYVRLIGADHLRAAPCDVIEEWPGGFLLLLLAEDFARLEDDPKGFEERRERLVRYLGPEYFHYMAEGSPKKVLPQFAQTAGGQGNG